MISFKNFLLEYSQSNIKKIQFVKNPKIGWWLDNDPCYFFHGTHINNLDFISKNGLVAPTEGSTAGWISLALEPNTAYGYASMSSVGGETAFRSAGKQVKNTPKNERIVFILKIPKSYFIPRMAEERGAMQSTKNKLTDKSLYDNFSGTDSKYYELTEIRLPHNVPAKFIKGYMTK